jgi:hypothetical protein
MKFGKRFFLPVALSALALNLTGCAGQPEQTLATKTDHTITASYYSVRNDRSDTLSQRFKQSFGLQNKVSEEGSYYYALLGQGVALICSNDTECAQSSNLATMTYTIDRDGEGFVLRGKLKHDMGASTKSKGPAGELTWSIDEDAPLYKEGQSVQNFELPLSTGKTISMMGPLGDKLIIVVE